jgi:hypothetical protein
MFAEIRTTITSRVEVTDEGLGEVTHDVHIDPGDLPQNAALALAKGGARTFLAAFDEEDGNV